MHHLAAILFVDIVGYSILMGKSEENALSAIGKLSDISKPLASSNNGKWHKDLGDGLLFSFSSALDAVKCAIQIQKKVNATENFQTRIGIHAGEVKFEGGDIFGDGVNIAARIQGQAAEGGIAISQAVQQNILNKSGISVLRMGRYKLKNIKEEVVLYQVSVPGVEIIHRRSPLLHPSLWILTGLVVGFFLHAILVNIIDPDQDTGIQKYSIPLPRELPLELIGTSTYGAGQRAFDISPDGSMVVYVAGTNEGTILAIRENNSFESRLLKGTNGAFFPFFSPDGKWIGYFTNEQLYRVSIEGQRPEILSDVHNPMGAVWMDDNQIVFSDHDGAKMRRLSVENRQSVENLRIGVAGYWPSAIPGTHSILFSQTNEIFIHDISSEKTSSLIKEGTTPVYIEPGYIVYVNQGRLKVIGFDKESRTTTGSPTTVLDNIRTESVRRGSQYAVSRMGKLVFVDGADAAVGQLQFVNRKGNPVDTIDLPKFDISHYSLSPNGKYLLYKAPNSSELNIHDVDRNVSSLVAKNAGMNAWTRDSKYFCYSLGYRGKYYIIKRSINGLEVDTLVKSSRFIGPYSWSHDMQYLSYVIINEQSIRDIMYIDLRDKERIPRTMTNTPIHETFSDFSPNGDFFVYVADEVYVKPFPPAGQKIKISDRGRGEPYWLNDGNEIVYYDFTNSEMVSVEIDWSMGFSPKKPKVLWKKSFMDIPGRSFNVTPDGNLFLMKRRTDEQNTRERIIVIENFLSQLQSAL